MLIDRTQRHTWVPSLCACHPQNCAQLVTEKEKGRVPAYDLCGLPMTDWVHIRDPRARREQILKERGIHG